MEETENFREVDVATSAKFFGTKITSFSILLMIVASIIAIDAFDWFEGDEDGEDESDLVKTNPPPEIDLQPGRIYSDENIYINEDGTGNFRTHCTESHVNNDDPLVYPGQTGAAHEHVFFGFPETDANTTTEQLRNATDQTTCEGVALNQAAYWVPSLFSADGTRLEYVEPLFYYKSGYHIPAELIQAPPEGLVMIAGHDRPEPQDVISAK